MSRASPTLGRHRSNCRRPCRTRWFRSLTFFLFLFYFLAVWVRYRLPHPSPGAGGWQSESLRFLNMAESETGSIFLRLRSRPSYTNPLSG